MQQTIHKSSSCNTRNEESVHGKETSRRLWFERLAAKLRLPLWLGIPLVAVIPTVSLWAIGIEIRIATDFTMVPAVSLPFVILNMLFLAGSSRLISRRVECLRQYTATLIPRKIPHSLNLLYSLTPVALIWALLVLASGLLFDPVIFRLYYPLQQSLLRVLVTSYIRLGQATFLWVLGYAMYSIYKWGNLPVKLKSFAEDSTLGLKPYGSASLSFVTLYIVGVLLTFPIVIYVGEAVLLSQSIFYLLGLVIFLGPLLGLRRRLLEAKHEKLHWIGTRHSRVKELVEATGDGPLDTAIVNELIAIDNIRRDVQQIHTWPFNPGILAKMVTVVMLPLVLAIIATYLIHILQL